MAGEGQLMATNKIRLMVVDDHEVVRTGLRAILEPEDDIEVVAEAPSAVEAARQAEAEEWASTPDDWMRREARWRRIRKRGSCVVPFVVDNAI